MPECESPHSGQDVECLVSFHLGRTQILSSLVRKSTPRLEEDGDTASV